MVGKHTPLMLTIPFSGFLYNGAEEGSFFFSLSAYSHLASKFFPSLSLQHSSSGFPHRPAKTSSLVQWVTTGFSDFYVHRQPLLDYLDYNL